MTHNALSSLVTLVTIPDTLLHASVAPAKTAKRTIDTTPRTAMSRLERRAQSAMLMRQMRAERKLATLAKATDYMSEDKTCKLTRQEAIDKAIANTPAYQARIRYTDYAKTRAEHTARGEYGPFLRAVWQDPQPHDMMWDETPHARVTREATAVRDSVLNHFRGFSATQGKTRGNYLSPWRIENITRNEVIYRNMVEHNEVSHANPLHHVRIIDRAYSVPSWAAIGSTVQESKENKTKRLRVFGHARIMGSKHTTLDTMQAAFTPTSPVVFTQSERQDKSHMALDLTMTSKVPDFGAMPPYAHQLKAAAPELSRNALYIPRMYKVEAKLAREAMSQAGTPVMCTQDLHTETGFADGPYSVYPHYMVMPNRKPAPTPAPKHGLEVLAVTYGAVTSQDLDGSKIERIFISHV